MKRNIKNIIAISLICSIPAFAAINDDIKKVAKKSKSKFIKNIYSSNMYEPIWIKDGGLSNLGKELIAQMKKDKTLDSDLPFYKLYKQVLRDINNKKYNASLELKLTKLYKAYMDYLIKGGIDWKAFDRDLARLRKKYDYSVAWERFTPPYSSSKILSSALISGTFGNYFSKVEPKRFKYQKLKKYLQEYIAIKHNGGWKTVHPKTNLRVGSSSSYIPAIRKRLKIVGDLPSSCTEPMDSPIYDSCMSKGVKRFKLRHGLRGTSIIDRGARAELARGVNYYIKKMRLNLDRIKWSKRDEARVRIELNIPAFRLYMYDGKGLVTTMRVVTGKPDHPTPVFSDVMTTVVVNPYWRIPESIVRKEMLKHLIKNPHYYERQGKYLYKGWGPNSEKINPATVNWKKYLNNKKPIPYHFMQSPGSRNALGKIKFLFPNKYSVYIHDTPSKRLFFRETRAFSHGCMRIQKPRELLEALSLYNSNIHVDSIMRRLGTDDNQQIALRRRIPIDITYFTSFVDDYGNLHFRKDIYGYDRLQLKHYYKGYSSLASNDIKENKKSSKAKKKIAKKEKAKEKKKVKTKDKAVAQAKYRPVKKEAEKKVQVQPKPQPTKPKQAYEVIEIGY